MRRLTNAVLAPLFLILLHCTSAVGQSYNIYTVAGGGIPNDVPATSVRLPPVTGGAVDGAGNAYFAAPTWNVVFRLDAANGRLTRIAGSGLAGYSGDNGPAASAELFIPIAVAVDPLGDVYIADAGNNVIRKVSRGIITTIAGGGTQWDRAYSGPATSAELAGPTGVAVDASGNVYIADSNNGVIRKVSNGLIAIFAGGGNQWDPAYKGPATSASLWNTYGVAVDLSGNVYIAESGNGTIREVSNGVITTIAGGGTQVASMLQRIQTFMFNRAARQRGLLHALTHWSALSKAGARQSRIRNYTTPMFTAPATDVMLDNPIGVAVDASGNVFIADAGYDVIAKVSGGVISGFAGNGTRGYGGDGGPATSASFLFPAGVAADALGNVYITDFGNAIVRKVSQGVIATVAGNTPGGTLGGGVADTSAALSVPSGIAVDASGSVYIADTGNSVVRKISNGIITNFAGNGTWGYSGDNGPATSAELNPIGVAVDRRGDLYVADYYNSVIRKVSKGVITTFAGSGARGRSGDNGPATSAKLSRPTGVAVDASGNVYIADAQNGLIRKVSDGVITLFAGGGDQWDPTFHGPATSAALRDPECVAVDATGAVYIADTNNNMIRKVSNGVITTFAGTGQPGYSGDNGPATGAKLHRPRGIAVDAAGNVYFSDWTNNAIRMVSGGVISTIAGGGIPVGPSDGSPASGQPLNHPLGVAVDAGGTVYITDSYSGLARALIAPPATLGPTVGHGSFSVTAPPDRDWTAKSNVSWISITGGSLGTGSGTVSFTVEANTGASRIGTVSINGQTCTIVQQGASAAELPLAGSLAQIASAGGWDTTLTLVNLGSTAAEARLNLYGRDGTAPWLPFTLPQQTLQGTILGSMIDKTVAPGALLSLDMTGPSGQASVVGSAQLHTSGNVGGFGIFQIQATGQQAVVPLETRNAPSYLLAFDSTTGVGTGLALANVSATAGDVKVIVRDDAGAVIPTSVGSIHLDGDGHASFMLNDAAQGFPEIAGKRGTVEFDTPSGGQISVLGIRAHGKAITTLPVLAQVGTTGGSLAHVATGAGWETLFTLVNTGTTRASLTLHFYDEKTGTPLPLPLVFPQGGTPQTTDTVTQTLAPGATLLIQTQGSSAAVTCSAQLTTTGNVGGFAIFQIQASGQEAVVPLETRNSTAFVLAYDNTNGLATGVALANLTATTANVNVVVRDDTGATLTTGQVPLAGNGHASFMLIDPTQGFPATADRRGTVEFDTPSGGKISALGIRAVDKVITTIPVLAKQQ